MTDKPTVTQADRETAAKLVIKQHFKDAILAGHQDNQELLQIIAAHREAAIKEARGLLKPPTALRKWKVRQKTASI